MKAASAFALFLLLGGSTLAAELPDRSLYLLDAAWTNQAGQGLNLRELAGRPRVVTMFFTSCGYACPRLVDDLKALASALTETERQSVGFVLFSFDDQVDVPARLADYAHSKQLSSPAWTLLHAGAGPVREVSAALDIPYRRLPDGTFDHGNALVLLDAQGVPAFRLTGLGADPAPLIAALRALLSTAPADTMKASGKP